MFTNGPGHLGVVAIEKGAFWLPSTTVANFTLLYMMYYQKVYSFIKDFRNEFLI